MTMKVLKMLWNLILQRSIENQRLLYRKNLLDLSKLGFG
jgi:hypothetical protein